MLSRVEDVRVFESSDDVILRSSSRRYSRQQLNGEDVDENEQLHPQHPYRMRKRVLQRENEDFHQLNGENDQVLVPFWNQENNRPMEFVFLSSGEIRAREDCPPGLGLPKLQDATNASRSLAYNTQEFSYESDEEDRRTSSHKNQAMKLSRQQVRRPVERPDSDSSLSEDAGVSSDADSELDSPEGFEERLAQGKEAQAEFQQRTRQVTRNAKSRGSAHEGSRGIEGRAPHHSLRLDHLRIEEEEEARKTTEVEAWKQEKQTQATDEQQTARIAYLEEQVRLQESKISRLKHDKKELQIALKQLKKTENSGQRLDTKEVGILKKELDEMTQRLQGFLVQVEKWKDNTKKELQYSNDKSGLSAVLENLWVDFPRVPGVSTNVAKEKPSPTSEQQHQLPGGEDQVEAVHFLKKRLHQREEELRQTHVKYVELKELCARQCVREADLQNFINEHRLRGNLIIRKTDSAKPNGSASNQEPEQDDYQDEHRQSTKLKVMSSRGTNTPASYASVTSSSRHRPTLGECPPGCGSRPSFMRRKAPTATRAKTSKRAVSSTASKGAVGVIRPWM